MSKNAIWGIIILMSVALMGIVALQVYWIGQRLYLEEAFFDENVFLALNNVSERLEKEEKRRYDPTIWNAGRYNKKKSFFGGKESDHYSDLDGVHIGSFSKKHRFDTLVPLHTEELECNCFNCRLERFRMYERTVERHLTEQNFGYRSLEERFHNEYLDTFIIQELRNRNIDLNYTYGVYNTEKGAFTIRDGKYNYVALEKGDFGSQAVSLPDLEYEPDNYLDLKNSKFSVQLFKSSLTIAPQGYLNIHFPGKTGYVWRAVWTTLGAAILFTGIILFCFVYTMQIIFTQKKLSKIKSDFINNMTHEFKTPIATISLASDSITSPMISGNPAKVQRFANIIKQENRRMNSQVEKVLQMALLDKKDFQLKLTQVDAHEVVRQAVNNIGLRLEKKGGKSEAILNATNSFIEADLTHFSNVVNNLLDNAYKYSKESPHISVTTENVANGIKIKVKDNGIGMSKEARKHIFDKFYRVHTGNLHDVKGFGLGLSYVKAILTAHKGQIDVKSELGKGSEFILFFPFLVNQ